MDMLAGIFPLNMSVLLDLMIYLYAMITHLMASSSLNLVLGREPEF
jgi:hypothetical protein